MSRYAANPVIVADKVVGYKVLEAGSGRLIAEFVISFSRRACERRIEKFFNRLDMLSDRIENFNSGQKRLHVRLCPLLVGEYRIAPTFPVSFEVIDTFRKDKVLIHLQLRSDKDTYSWRENLAMDIARTNMLERDAQKQSAA